MSLTTPLEPGGPTTRHVVMMRNEATTGSGADAAETLSGGDRFDLGVLLVRGIGESRRGEPLTTWGRALVEGLGDWLGPQRQVRVGATRLAIGTPRRRRLALGHG